MSVFLVLALVSQLVLWCVIAWSPGSALGGLLAFLLLCAGLPTFVIIIIYLFFLFYYYLPTNDNTGHKKEIKMSQQKHSHKR